MFKKLQINIPFAEALEQMPSYIKFLKEFLTKKRKLTTEGSTILTEECNAIMKLPPKLKDPGSFNIPCTIGSTKIDRVLCDLGSSINVMPLSVMQKLGITEVKPTRVIVQLADRSTKQAYGVIEDILVKVDKFIIPMDFVILDIEENDTVPMIFGRPFLATSGALIDVPKGKLILRIEGETATLNVFQEEKPPPTTRSEEVFCITEKETEEKDKKGQEPAEKCKPKVKMEKPKSKEKQKRTKIKVLEAIPTRPYEHEYYYGKGQFMVKGMAAALNSSYKPP